MLKKRQCNINKIYQPSIKLSIIYPNKYLIKSNNTRIISSKKKWSKVHMAKKKVNLYFIFVVKFTKQSLSTGRRLLLCVHKVTNPQGKSWLCLLFFLLTSIIWKLHSYPALLQASSYRYRRHGPLQRPLIANGGAQCGCHVFRITAVD